ncbi:MFS transporter [Arcanobacterium phocae]|uniref:MFS transporter n=1 Tax=Arcanobacterium phocae TaxID=131112 RepID=UPI001C0E97B1|nr:MFS transporter [Arcanobacterium phocae]
MTKQYSLEQHNSALPQRTWYAVAYLASNALSILGNSLITVILPVLIIIRLGSPTWAGIIAVATTSAQVCAGFLGGALADRINRRTLSLTADLLSALSVFTLFVIDWIGLTSALWFITLGILGAFADVPGQTARQALGPQVATSSSIKYETITGYFQTLQGGALIIGPALAGVFLIMPDPSWALLATGICSLLAAFTTALIPYDIGEYQSTTQTHNFIGHITTSITLIRKTPLLRFAITFAIGINVLYTVTQSFVLPTHFTLLNQRQYIAWILTAMGGGMMVGGIIYGLLAKKITHSTLFLSSTFLSFIGALMMLSLWDLSAVINGAFFLGIAFAIINASATIAIMESLPEGKRGSVMGIILTLILAVYPLGFALATVLYTYSGLTTVRLVLAGGFAVTTAWALMSKQSHALNIAHNTSQPTSKTTQDS